jgi:NYN domain
VGDTLPNTEQSYVRSALLVDFDNIYSSLNTTDPTAARNFATDPLRWFGWLEGTLGSVGPGADDKTPRVILYRVCYLNPARYSGYRAYFTRAGFRVVDCPALTNQGKNSADIHMVLDALDLLTHSVRYDEFIVFSLDADFTPLFQRLRSHDRRIVMLGSGPSSAALRNTCDYVIPDDVFVAEALLGDTDQAAEDESVLEAAVEAVMTEPSGSAADHPICETTPASSGPAPTESQSGEQSVPNGSSRASTVASTQSLRDRIAAILEEMLAESDRPVMMVDAADTLRREVGRVVIDSGWAGAGTFKQLLARLDNPGIAFHIDGAGAWIYDPRRHDLTGVGGKANSQDGLVGPWADVAKRLCRVLGLPGLTPDQWAGVFSAIAEQVGAGTGALSIMERNVAQRLGLSRSRVHFVVLGLRLAGYRFDRAGDHSPAALGKVFLENVYKLAENAQLALDESDRAQASDWILGELPSG